MNSFDRPIHTQAELEATWRDVVTPLGWSSPRFWIMLIEPSGMPLPQLIEIDELEGVPRDDDIEHGAQFLRMLIEHLDVGDIRVAFLYARPGHESIQPLDRRWATSLASMARQAGIACEPVHLANDVRIVPIPLDELDAA
jgi:hypothetical protein